jgi:DNA (cytosine-5)-methyltransferase 1
LGEGFASFTQASGRKPFHLAISLEMDAWAHSTLQFRAFMRQLARPLTAEEWIIAAGSSAGPAALMERFPCEAERARGEALRRTLGDHDPDLIRQEIHSAIAGVDEAVLIGGPPCQAYSLVGRSRNRGKPGYVPENDHRQTLYVEYLQILADHGPAVFVMENVKGLKSAALNSRPLFERILEDLSAPSAAIRREGRSSTGRGRAYDIFSLNPEQDLFGTSVNHVLRAEQFGVPQARHRVILVGVRRDLGARPPALMPLPPLRVHDAIADLPRLRSSVSGGLGSAAEWKAVLNSITRSDWFRDTPPDMRSRLRKQIARIRAPRCDTGSNILERSGQHRLPLPWLGTHHLPYVLNHQARSHMSTDLQRYFFAACWAEIHGRSPSLGDFPRKLLPAHRNVTRALAGALFSDRFRVQTADRPSTTITSHISKDGHYFIHHDPTQCRSLTVREAARLQTFPDDYLFTGPRTAQYQQVGNAVPPHLARQIAASVAAVLGIS